MGQAGRHSSGLALRIDPARGIVPELTLATEAPMDVIWHDAYEDRCLANWARSHNLDPSGLLLLRRELRSQGAAPRTLHTVTLARDGLTAAVYFRPEGLTHNNLERAFIPEQDRQPTKRILETSLSSRRTPCPTTT